MLRTILAPAAVAALLGLLTSSHAHAYGACRTQTTYVNPYNDHVTTTTNTAAYGPNGAYHHESVSGFGPNGSYEASGTRAYSPTMYGGYSAAGVSGGAYRAGVVRYP